ncbi:MAG: KilA-N domain-containing protein, partial [Phormidesmis sp.]
MTENSIVRLFNEAAIEQRVADGYINLNQMAEATGKRIDNWLRLQSTKELIAEFNSQIASSDLR